MSDDQLVEVPRKQLFERSPCELSIRERQPNIDRNAAWICNASKFVKSVEKGEREIPGGESFVREFPRGIAMITG
jgi:hypothetical protein